MTHRDSYSPSSYIITISEEYSSDRIVDWCIKNNINICRCNTDSFNALKLKVAKDVSNIKIITRKYSKLLLINNLPNELFRYLSKETSVYWLEFLSRYKKQIVCGHHLFKIEPLRTSALEIAKNCNLLVPDYIITSSKIELTNFSLKHSKIICKSLGAPQNFVFNDLDLALKTSDVNKDDIEQMEEYFCPTYFQEKIERDYEVRLFYLRGNMWAMAYIISKENEIAADIGDIKRMREVPIIVPKNIEKNIIKYMELSGYNTGSLDFIIKNNKWYFLETNPSGQYAFVSKACNYFLDREIAKVLI